MAMCKWTLLFVGLLAVVSNLIWGAGRMGTAICALHVWTNGHHAGHRFGAAIIAYGY